MILEFLQFRKWYFLFSKNYLLPYLSSREAVNFQNDVEMVDLTPPKRIITLASSGKELEKAKVEKVENIFTKRPYVQCINH